MGQDRDDRTKGGSYACRTRQMRGRKAKLQKSNVVLEGESEGVKERG